ncbi:four-helix bundle copper-binding protein [Anaeropeptidivorans aminofermentans]|uniref:four-helix bundle copper-binding protein n=1 Tax=Anaeropeptidivorans aminofermentans TaxID=2934315 RepID=UPI002025AE33|nr:four-helix bundle copper-binding protein [Anaeropeptidivorans aminofermentans]
MSIVGKPLNNYQQCIDACLRCFQACHECAVLCLQEPDVESRTNHIAMMMECAGICNEAACLMTMNSKHAKEFCMLCAKVCEECANGCAQFKDDHCQQCAAECQKCAAACMAM